MPTVTQHASPYRTAFRWLGRETVAMLGVAGAAMTVIANLANTVLIAPAFVPVVTWWRDLTHLAIRPPFEMAGIALHSHLVAAIAFAVFLTIMGAGARIAAAVSGPPLVPPRQWAMLDGMTWPSLIVFAGLVYAFLIGHDPKPMDTPLVVFGSEDTGQFVFALVATSGYIAGDFIGQRSFHGRILRLGVLVIAILICNQILVS